GDVATQLPRHDRGSQALGIDLAEPEFEFSAGGRLGQKIVDHRGDPAPRGTGRGQHLIQERERGRSRSGGVAGRSQRRMRNEIGAGRSGAADRWKSRHSSSRIAVTAYSTGRARGAGLLLRKSIESSSRLSSQQRTPSKVRNRTFDDVIF